jgi:hypothetical protein
MNTSHPMKSFVLRMKSLVRRPMLRLYSMGGERNGEPLRALVADDSSTLPYLRSLIFPDGAKTVQRGWVPSVTAARLSDAEADLVVVAANQFLLPLYANRGFHFIPKWVRLCLRVWDHPDVMVAAMRGMDGKTLRHNLERAAENGFRCETSNDPALFEMFYRDMYVSYATARFGELATLDSYAKLKSNFERGTLLVALQHDRPVGGVILVREGDQLYTYRSGYLSDRDDYVRNGASVAQYYYSLEYAHRVGCTSVDFGHSRPFLSDGILRFKLKWGMTVRNVDDGIGVFALAAPGRTQQAVSFLSENRFYHLTREGIVLCDEC